MVVLVMAIAPLFGFSDRNFVFFFGLGVALLILWSSNFNWSRFGIGKRITIKTVLKSLVITLAFFIGFNIIIDPILKSFLGEFDLSSIEDIKGNFVGYLVLMVIVWVFAAFGEEFLFRGYYMKSLAELLGNGHKAWILSALITSIYFGVSHAYQGTVGAVSVFLWSLAISLLFYKNRNNLLLLVLVHGFHDSIGITLLYLDKYDIVIDYFKELLHFS